MFWTEQKIKEHLDGKFYAVDVVTGNVEFRTVPVDYIPSHKSAYSGDRAGLSEIMRMVKANPWLEEEDEKLLAMRQRGVKWESIRKMMQRGEKSIKERYLKLCKERGIEPIIATTAHAPLLTNEAKARIIMLRKQGLSPSQVAEMTGRPTYQVVDYYNRFLATKRLREVV